MSDDLRPIETVYNGFRFRSRLEARWAVYLDAVDMPYEYELEGFDLPNVGKYLPDFYLPQPKTYIEIKSSHLAAAETHLAVLKCCTLSYVTGKRSMVMFGNPWPGECMEWMIDTAGSAQPSFPARGSILHPDVGRNGQACIAARQARFDHGQTPLPPLRMLAPVPSAAAPVEVADATPTLAAADRQFLERLPQKQRGTVANWMLEPIRSGITEPGEIVAHVRKVIAERLGQAWRWRDTEWAKEDAVKFQVLQTAMQSFPAEALNLARYYVAYEALPRAAREKLKASNHTAFAEAARGILR